MRVLICGGRDYDDYDTFKTCLSAKQVAVPFTVIIHGAATGADTMADKYAKNHNIAALSFPVSKADWKKYGKSAGPRRNRQMLRDGKPDLIMAFPGGSGTADMVKQARKAGVPVWQF